MVFFVLAVSPNEKGDIAEIDEHPPNLMVHNYMFKDGVSLLSKITGKLEYKYSDDVPKGRRLVDLQRNSLGMFIFSPKLKAVVGEQPNVEFIPIRLLDHKGKITSEDYCIANVVDPVDCIDLANSNCRVNPLNNTQFNRIRKLVLDEDKVPKDLHLFRLKQRTRTLIVTEALAKKIINQNLEGPLLVPIDKFDSAYFLGV